jgi:predicted TIM-barrel fold metal-dependent hydrolase
LGFTKPIVESIAALGIYVVTDHFALLKGSSMLLEKYRSDPTHQPGFADIISLVRSGVLYVKLSAPYRVSDRAPNYEDLRPIVEALVKANPKKFCREAIGRTHQE